MEGLPLIPGYAFQEPKQTRFHLPQHFNFKNGYAVLRPIPCGIGKKLLDVESISYCKEHEPVRYDPSLTYGQVKRYKMPQFLPHFVRYSNKCLTFHAFFKQSVMESPLEQFRIRPVNIIYFLEDDTITVMEPVVENSGFVQGRLIKRNKIPKNRMNEYWHWKDLNIGMDVSFFGTTFHIVDCDAFTKEYLKSQGMELNTPENMPADPYIQNRQMKLRPTSSKPSSADSKMRKFFELDGKILRFYAAWDNQDREYGDLRPFIILYYLADDTVEVQEVHEKNDGCDPFPLLLKKIRLPKGLKNLQADFPSLCLEPSEEEISEYYTPKDFLVGKSVSILGRRFIIYDADSFTRQYYEKVFHIFQPPRKEVFKKQPPPPQPEIPPYMGFGTPEDSYQSCLSLMPQPPKKDVVRYIVNANKYLRYTAKLDWVHPEDEIREFVLSYSLADGTVNIQEPPLCNSGIIGGTFLKSMRIPKPGISLDRPEYYTAADFYIGAKVEVFSHIFIITDADLFVYHYMLDHPDNFPGSVIDNFRDWFNKKGMLTAEETKHKVEEDKEEVAKNNYFS